ncbi:putative glycoside hydrolase, partial [Proteus vulgaris]
PAALRIGGKPINLGREANGDLSLALTYRLDRAAMGTVTLAMGEGKGIDATSLFTGETGKWRTVKILLKCYQANGTD